MKMRKAIILLTAVVLALCANAVNRLYLEDFTICPGETMQVALILENDKPFTAFQTDIILPQGLSIVQEDGDFLFELTNRKASDHTFISKLRADSAIRVVSFSIGVKPYSGNSGALLIINLTAADSFKGSAVVELKNSILATLQGEEEVVPGASALASMNEQQLPGDTNGDCEVNISDVSYLIDYLLMGCTSSFHTENADLNNDNTIGIGDVAALIDLLLQG